MRLFQVWAVLDAKYTLLAERAKLSDSNLSGLAATAQRIVTENTVFRFDGGESAFAAAEKAGDPTERAELLATGVRRLIDEGMYAEAVQRMADIRDEKFLSQLNANLSFRTAEASINKLDWSGFNSQFNCVVDARLRTSAALGRAGCQRCGEERDLLRVPPRGPGGVPECRGPRREGHGAGHDGRDTLPV